MATIEFETYKSTVHHLLRTEPRTRIDDNYLILRTLEIMGVDVNLPYVKLMQTGCLNHIETITRLRRKFQEEDPSLGQVEVQKRRHAKQEQVKEYIRNFQED